ncbi:Stage V sporulation protein involved in spore cortex synthesis (SpoVR) [Desulfosporosinus sp. I2]|uniref:SpoVR family protein n=1 Tax=Desulfosporosinus sp. I2 TaxID=1617025 RepID=UPI0005F0649C|nr:SpoVR family protein [Desulfosporosinus sp. I2]KJR44612.1 Stage V sporulation protein involved in spore cortex synthesis (SpoVR) [Desulfosporosinus sp. I2]
MDNEQRSLSTIAQDIAQVARGLGLKFCPVNFEIVPAEALYTFGAYGMPVRFTHWSFGKAFYRMKLQYDLNLSRIYELVINTNPAYAFLLEGNRLIQNKLVIGHVYAHVDFFNNNRYFQRTPKDMVERMGAHAEKIREYEVRFGREQVEKTLDAVLAIQEHVDYRSHISPDTFKNENGSRNKCHQEEGQKKLGKKKSSPYDDLWGDLQDIYLESSTLPEVEDLLLYLVRFAPGLEEWQRDVISIVREESLYFYPQIETKIINEGWATFWHSRIMHELDLSDAESLDFALMHSQVVQPSRLGLNPYYLGVKIWEYLASVKPLDYLWDLRETENDLSFIRNHLTRELVEDLHLFNFRKVGAHWQVTENEWQKVRDNLVQQLVNGGNPRIIVLEGDYEGKGGLSLKHRHEGVDLDIVYLEKTLALVQFLWGKPVVLETVVDHKNVLYECSNGIVSRRQATKIVGKEVFGE